MTDPMCTLVRRLTPLSEQEPAADRFVDLSECLADLLVATVRQLLQIAQAQDGDDPHVREATERLAGLEHRCASRVAKPLRSTSFCSTRARSDRRRPMERSSSVSDLLAQVELALPGGCNVEQIETELLAGGHLEGDERAAAWLYAWARGPVPPARGRALRDTARACLGHG